MRKLLPCPVCGGESFIESVTQGGLICYDCGAVSNQVEVADDEDDPAARPSFIRPHTYTHVTEEQSQAKREARVLLKIRDERTIGDLLEGLQRILVHMTESLVSKGHCTELTVVTVRDAWFTFVTRSALLSPSPGVLERRSDYNKVDSVLGKWGIPNKKGQAETVTASMPSERRKQWSALLLMMEERNLSVDNMVVVDDSPPLIYAHDWLCGFFKLDQFPLPDTVLVSLLPIQGESPVTSLGYEEICGLVASIEPDPSVSLSSGERKSAVRRLFQKVVLCEKLRAEYFESEKLPLPQTLVQDLPRIDMNSLLAIIIIGIRNAGGGIVPAQILNWIARGDLPFFSAHKILTPPIDRIEYYWLSDAQNTYMRSAFCPGTIPSVAELESLVYTITHVVGVPCRLNDPFGLLKLSIDMLGVGSDFHIFLEKLIKTNLFGMTMWGQWLLSYQPVENRNRWSKSRKRFDPYNEENLEKFLFSDITPEEYVAVVILFGMKLVFPALHPTENLSSSSEEIQPVANFDYEVLSRRDMCLGRAKFGSLAFWDMLSGPEKSALLSFVTNERSTELRPCLVEDIRTALGEKGSDDKFSGKTWSPGIVLKSGKLTAYVLSPPTIDMEGTLAYLIRDVMRVCGCDVENDVYRIHQLLRELERRFFSPSFKFT